MLFHFKSNKVHQFLVPDNKEEEIEINTQWINTPPVNVTWVKVGDGVLGEEQDAESQVVGTV
jgi:hypothetical protein